MDLPALDEDAIYRTSTQYRKWSFTPLALATARKATNSAASKRVRSLLNSEVDTLSVDEETLLVTHFSKKLLELASHLRIPPEVAATAVQFLRRFYILNSCMDYHPQQIATSALFLATKTDNHYMSLREFAKKCLPDQEPVAAQETIVAPEFRLMQGLQFAFDVRHPRRGLEAGMMLLEDISQGRFLSPSGQSGSQLQSQMSDVVGRAKGERLAHMHTSVKGYLRHGAILTDAYFLYTPSQIWIAAMAAADKDLAGFYLNCILNGLDQSVRSEVEATIAQCQKLVISEAVVNEEERKRVSKKLRHCTNPETADLVKLNAAQKREASETDGNAMKKLKADNGKAVRSDPFGPGIEHK